MSKRFQINAIRDHSRSLSRALSAALGFIIVGTVVMSPAASYSSRHHTFTRAARSLNATTTAHLHLVRAEGSELFEEGAVSGALPGSMQAELKTGAVYTGNFVTRTHSGSIKGRGTAAPHGAGRYQSFSGTFISPAARPLRPRQWPRRALRRIRPPQRRRDRPDNRQTVLLRQTTRNRHKRVRRNLVLAALSLYVCLSGTAHAAPSAKLRASFVPEQLGQSTTLEFNAQIAASKGRVPPPLTELDVRYPGSLGVAVGELGLATCSKRRLEALGAEGCPADSRMGEGSATAEIPIGPEIVRETAKVAILRAPEQEGHLALLLRHRRNARVRRSCLAGLLLTSPPPYGASIHINVPLVPSLPGAPMSSVVHLHATLGPLGLTYYEHVRGKLVSYKPRGILLPKRCPRGGFRFSATFAFLDGSDTIPYQRAMSSDKNHVSQACGHRGQDSGSASASSQFGTSPCRPRRNGKPRPAPYRRESIDPPRRLRN